MSEALRAAIAARLRSDPSQKVRNARQGGLEFRCPTPGHDDGTPSAWMGDGAWKCLGCGEGGNLRDLAGLLGVDVPDSGYTLDEYARSKGFDPGLLREWGLETVNLRGREVLCIPYLDQEGNLLRNRYRAESGKRWWEGRDRPIYPYGMERLTDLGEGARVLVVEGESDCHAAWHEGMHAIGVPGANTWRSEWAPLLRGLEVYVWEEPDEGGAALVRSIAHDFPDARVVQPDGVKDLAELRRRANGDFEAKLEALLATARRIGTPDPPVAMVALLGAELERIAERKAQPIDATPTLYPSWNRVCRGSGGGVGLGRGWHVVVGAKSGAGKSLTAANIANSAARHGEVVTFLNLEMDTDEVATRVLASFAGLAILDLEHGKRFNRSTWELASRALSQEHERSGGMITTNREPIRTLRDILDCIRWSHEVQGSRFVIIDYLQLAWTGRGDHIFDRISEVSHEIRRLAKTLRVTTVGCSQLNRMVARVKEQPSKEGLMGGSPLENDADQVLLLDHSRVSVQPNHDVHAYAILDKNRHGKMVEFPTVLEAKTLKLREAMPDEEQASLTGVA